jgi:predicted nucleic acid-binding protein
MEKGKLILCDTDVVIEFYRNNPSIKETLRQIGQQNIALSAITAGELLYGARNKPELKQIQKDISHLNFLGINEKTCTAFLNLMAKYVLSHKFSVPDGLIAATALTEDLELFTLNVRDFRYIEGLRLFERR